MKYLFFLILLFSQVSTAQESEIKWLDFEQLDDSLNVKAKPVLTYFYADWCVYCKKMERNAFKNPEVISLINQEFYAVKMNAESTDSIEFEGQIFINAQAANRRNGIHQIPLLLANRKDRAFSLPATLVLDGNFRIRKRSFEYLTSENMISLLKEKGTH